MGLIDMVESGAINLDLIDSKTLNERAKRIQAEIDTLNDDIPHQISRQHRLHAELLQIFGKFMADASHEHWKAEGMSEYMKSHVELDTEETGVVKKATALIAASDLQMMMRENKRETTHWK